HFVSDRYMANDSDLSSDHAVFTDFGTSCNTGLSCNNRILPDLDIVSDLNQVIEFHSLPDYRASQCCPVNGCVCSDFYTVFNDYISDLSNFFIFIFRVWSKAKAISTDDCSCVQCASIANSAI